MPKRMARSIDATEDDVEGHRKPKLRVDGSDEDDVEGHRKPKLRVDGSDGDDTEGHSFIPDPLSSRLLAQAREREIQGRMRDKSVIKESRNPFKRSKG